MGTTIKYQADGDNGKANVGQMAAMKRVLAVGVALVEDPAAVLMADDRAAGFDVAYGRKVFGFPFINGNTTNEDLGKWCGEVIASALNERDGR